MRLGITYCGRDRKGLWSGTWDAFDKYFEMCIRDSLKIFFNLFYSNIVMGSSLAPFYS